MKGKADTMALDKETGKGRLVPTRPTGVQYQVEYAIKLTVEIRQHGRAPAATRTPMISLSVLETAIWVVPMKIAFFAMALSF